MSLQVNDGSGLVVYVPPRRLVEEDECEEEGNDADGSTHAFAPVWTSSCLGADERDAEHAYGLSERADDENRFAAMTLDGPGRVQGKYNSERRVERVDELDRGRRLEHLLVDDRRVVIQGLLTLCEISGEGKDGRRTP
jgi:hypothetical protein